MPAVIPVHTAIRDRLRKAAADARVLSDELEKLVPVKSRQPGGFHGKVDFSQPPWNPAAAHAVMDLHALARKLEREVRAEAELKERSRGGSSANTAGALDSVLAQAERADDWMVRQFTRELESWGHRAALILDLEEVPKKLPRAPGKPEPRCPWCRCRTLRARILENVIFCINPDCKDEQGAKLRARMEYSKMVGDYVIRCSDGIIMEAA